MGKERLSDPWETDATQELTEPDIDSLEPVSHQGNSILISHLKLL